MKKIGASEYMSFGEACFHVCGAWDGFTATYILVCAFRALVSATVKCQNLTICPEVVSGFWKCHNRQTYIAYGIFMWFKCDIFCIGNYVATDLVLPLRYGEKQHIRCRLYLLNVEKKSNCQESSPDRLYQISPIVPLNYTVFCNFGKQIKW